MAFEYYCNKCKSPLYFEDTVPLPQICNKCLHANDREMRTGAHLLQVAKSMGWPDDGEGALEFMLRRAREVAFEDCGKTGNTPADGGGK